MILDGPSTEGMLQKAREEVEKYRPRLGQLDGQLLAFVTDHIEQEHELLAAYQDIAEQSSDEYVRYLTELIVTDERRHHEILTEIANYLRAGVDGSDLRPRVPWLTRPNHPTALRQVATRLLHAEQRDRRQLRHFRRKLRPIRNTSLLSVLVEAMLLDTRKHILLLRAIRHTTRT
jgi:hypothetical protein